MKANALFVATLLTLLPMSAHSEPLAEPVVGPMQVCFKYSSFSLAGGERITDFDGGGEGMAVRIEGPNGTYRIGESEIFATPRLGRLVANRDGTRVYRLRGRSREYAIVGATTFSDGEDIVVIRLDGEALTGTSRDAQVYERFRVADPASLHCSQIFTYSWDAMFGLDH